MGLYMNGECNATNVQGKNYNLHKLQGGGHVPQCPITGDATAFIYEKEPRHCQLWKNLLKFSQCTAAQKLLQSYCPC